MVNILYAEDDLTVQKVTSELLKLYCDNLYCANDGKEALEIFQTHEIDLLITDITMPNMDGLELIEAIKKINPHILTLITTAHNDTNFFLQSIDLGIDGYILKPVNLEQFEQVITKFLHQLQERNKSKVNQKLLDQYKNALDYGAIISKTDIKGVITYANEAFCILSGYTKEELIGATHNIVRHPDSPSSTFENMWKTILSKEVWQGKIKNRKKDGSAYWVSVTIQPILNIDGDIEEFFAIRTDITLEMEYQDTLQNTIEKQLQEIYEKEKFIQLQSKHAAMGEMIDAIAHQWRQPLNIITMRTSFLVSMFEGEEMVPYNEIEECHHAVKQQIDHLNTTLDEFRTFLRPNKITENFFLRKVLKSVYTLLKDELITHQIEFRFDTIEDLQINGIENEFKHIFINLINNSKDAFLQNNIQNKIIEITTKYEEGKHSIMIQDNAGGIPTDIIEDIFRPNVTSKPIDKGTGIGLYITKQILEKIGATIWVTNQNGGAKFTIEF